MSDNSSPQNNTFTNTFVGKDLLCIRGERIVFSGLSFEMQAGDGLVLLGPNGSGKSSLLRLMAGLLPAAAGAFHWNGEAIDEDYEAFAARARYLGHHDAIKPVFTVSENLAFWAGLYGVPDSHIPASVDRAMESFELTRLKDVPGIMLSAGQKRRTNLARLVVAPADLWLLDEPTSALDKASVKIFEGVIKQHQENGGMVVLSTHIDIEVSQARELQLDEFEADPAHAAQHMHFAADLFDEKDGE